MSAYDGPESSSRREPARESLRLSRRRLLAMAGGAAAAVSLPGITHAQGSSGQMSFPYYPLVSGAYTPEGVRDILNMLVTMERFVVANLTASLSGAIQPGLSPLHIPIEQASAMSALAHVDFLESLGAQSLTDTFTVPAPPGEAVAVTARKEMITTIFVGAYLAAAREFAELGQPLLVKYAFQTGAEHAEHRALARAVQALESVANEMPPANKAFETDLFVYVRDAYALLSGMGLFGKLPVHLAYPSRDAVLAAAGPMAKLVLQRAPNNATTSVRSPASVTQERQ